MVRSQAGRAGTDRDGVVPGRPTEPDVVARRICVAGRVQGVGYRPFVFRLASELGLRGDVRNRTGSVEINVEGPAERLAAFEAALIAKSPPLARPRIDSVATVAARGARSMCILASEPGEEPRIFVPPDHFTCSDCIGELENPADRRYRYPFINCTQCGPRYTLITSLPYDRQSTTMAGFELCPACRAEYENPLDRRFHAEPVACPDCGPRVVYAGSYGESRTGEAAIARAVELLRSGGIVAVNGIGGYHLLCDALLEAAVERLRSRKHRPDKPLAVMFPWVGSDGLDSVRKYLEPAESETRLLGDPVRPIVLVKRRASCRLARAIAPGLTQVGAFLPYSPLHHLLLGAFGGPVVATSGNLSGEPVLTTQEDAEVRLAAVADAYLHHNRAIARPADDSVCRVIAGAPRPIRVGRGLAPLDLDLPGSLAHTVLAVGGHLKTTIALGWDRRAVMSPHIGDMDTPRSRQVFEQLVADLPGLYGVHPSIVVCDAHPNYATTRWARDSGLPRIEVQHHEAHASALAGEHAHRGELLVFAWDGIGYGSDGTLWGGECFRGWPGGWRRIARLAPFRLPGGDRAGREPWRSAASLCWHAGVSWPANPADKLLERAWRAGFMSPLTSSIGRLFDAAAAIVLGITHTSFEGQGPMLLEAAAEQGVASAIELPLVESDTHLLEIAWQPLLMALLDTTRTPEHRADLVHRTLAATILRIAERERRSAGPDTVGLTGGVFQNRRLCEYVTVLLEAAGFEVLLAERVPCNDGGLAYGQLVEAAHRSL